MGKRNLQPRVLANLTPWPPGKSGNPSGRPTAGATLREWLNVLCEKGLSEDGLRRIARDKKSPWPKRAAAERALRMLEAGDLADFAGLLKGENSLEDLRGMGINTEVIKKFKQKTRKEMVGHGDEAQVEEVIEREIELHDRAGKDFDRVTEHTDGMATAKQEILAKHFLAIEPIVTREAIRRPVEGAN